MKMDIQYRDFAYLYILGFVVTNSRVNGFYTCMNSNSGSLYFFADIIQISPPK